jgi:hypothetical protein
VSNDKNNEFKKYIELTDHLILGDHGQKYKTKVYLDQCYEDMDSIIIHSDNIYLKQYNMAFFNEKGCEVYSHPEDIVYLK